MKFYIVLIFLLLCNCHSSKQVIEIPSYGDQYSDQYRTKIEEARKLAFTLAAKFPAISIAVAKDGQLIWSEAFGYADINKRIKAKPNNLFRIYSVTKPLTGTLVAKLWEDGKLDIYKEISYYVPNLTNHLQSITVLQLLSHTSGIRNYKKNEWMKISNNNCKNVQDALNVFINDPLEFNPGEKYAYSSFNYVLLSLVIEKAGNKPFDELLNEYVFKPANMLSIYHDEPQKNRDNLVKFYRDKTKLAKEINNSCKWGGGGYNATAESIANFGNALINNKLVGKAALDLMLSPNKLNSGETINYGFGLGIWVDDNDQRLYAGHTGSGLGGSAALRICPDEQFVIAILGNLQSDEIKESISKFTHIFLD